MTEVYHDAIYKALADTLDPCSEFNGTRLNIVEMGLVRDICLTDGHAHVRLLLTDPACLFYFQIVHGIEESLMSLDFVQKVTVESTFDIWWSEDRMSEDASARLRALRSQREKEMLSTLASPADLIAVSN
ncbi:aromatic ring hydroxylase [Kineobactrum sediminis]|uniref:Aromatic ring hydroxylase n=1 Tax=Kineobactrum sediminis TaxID=1905677 RepID=A0A2N5Y4H7_9GAMM|nr:iron-sulfur cluster assembly protein [Kineobactrum sediminis]PLW83300.1 aromatic ring hydroxylase [Kineobactrum sediminis]